MKYPLLIIIATGLSVYQALAIALPFGTFDPRSIAMGGTGVASATSANAGYYNPALMAKYKERQEKAKNSRFLFPIAAYTATNNLKEIVSFDEQQFDDQLNNAINDFNNNTQTAQQLLEVALELQNNLTSISAEPVYFDSNLALVVGLADRREGGAFILSQRLVFDGIVNYSSDDSNRLDAYIEEAAFVAAGGNPQTLHPELYDANGNLISPSNDLNSSANATGAYMTELSMALSKELTLFNTQVALGVTPKFVKVTTYDANARASTNVSDYVENKNDFKFNLDFGIAKSFSHDWQAGLVVKNLISRDYQTDLGNLVRFRPQVRTGLGYQSKKWGGYALDIDVLENKALGIGDPTQMVGIGGEWELLQIKFRAGLSKNLSGTKNNANVLYAAGIHLSPFDTVMDFTYAGNSNQTSFSMQVGFMF